MKRTAAMLVAACLAGCDAGIPTEVGEVSGVVISTAEDQTTMGCIGTNWSTHIQLESKRVVRLCGRIASPGTSITLAKMSDGSYRL